MEIINLSDLRGCGCLGWLFDRALTLTAGLGPSRGRLVATRALGAHQATRAVGMMSTHTRGVVVKEQGSENVN